MLKHSSDSRKGESIKKKKKANQNDGSRKRSAPWLVAPGFPLRKVRVSLMVERCGRGNLLAVFVQDFN